MPHKSKAASKKIAKLRREGVPADQAVATAYNMQREGRLTPEGGYKRVKKPMRKSKQKFGELANGYAPK